jgi:uncharacterized protein YndB with AHSA1/START domain
MDGEEIRIARDLCRLAGCLVTLSVPGALAAEPVSQNGFAMHTEVSVSAPPAKVYDALVGQVGRWWNPDHTFSGDASNLSIDPRPGGCFCEKLPDGGGVEHMRVIYVAPRALLRMSGAPGPLQAWGLAGSMTWTLTAVPEGTKVEMSYSVGGFIEGGFEGIAPAVEAVLSEQVHRLKRYVETGKPTDGAGTQ